MSAAETQVIQGLGIIDEDAADSLGGVSEVQTVDNRLYTAEFKREVDAQPKFPVYIPGEYAEFVQVNGLTFIIAPEQVVMVPQVVKEILDNKRTMEKLANQLRRTARKKMDLQLSDMPEYIG